MKTFTYKNQTHHLISLDNDVYVSYENILKNSKKLDSWNTFVVKKFSKYGEPLNEYISFNKNIFKIQEVIEYTKKYNPELLI